MNCSLLSSEELLGPSPPNIIEARLFLVLGVALAWIAPTSFSSKWAPSTLAAPTILEADFFSVPHWFLTFVERWVMFAMHRVA